MNYKPYLQNDVYYPYLNKNAAPDGLFMARNRDLEITPYNENTIWQSNPWMQERQRLAMGLPVPGINYPLHKQFIMQNAKNHDASIYEAPHCGCGDCREGAIDLGKGSDCRQLAREADNYSGSFGPDLAAIYGSEFAHASESARNKMHSRVFNGADSGRLVPNWDGDMSDGRITGRYLADSGRQLPPVAFGQPIPYIDEYGNRNIVLAKIPNTGRGVEQYEFESRTGYTPDYRRVIAPDELRAANMRQCADNNNIHCVGGYKKYGYVQGAHANSNILQYKPCFEFLNNCTQ